jgi:GNAT superfamily N-acetyltransferase
MIRALAEYEKASHQVTATEAKLREICSALSPRLKCCWCTTRGLAVFFAAYSTFVAQAGLYLEDLYVNPHPRGQGIGLALIKHLAAIAVDRGYGRLEWGVLNWNQPSIQFYKKLGAVPMDGVVVFAKRHSRSSISMKL